MTSTKTTIAQKLADEERTVTDLANKSWYDECEEAKEEEEMTDNSRAIIDVKSDVDSSPEKSPNGSPSSDSSTNKDREILVSFLDSTNEEKYERLLKEEKIKTTFKRRLSPNSSIASSDSNEKERNGDPSSDHSPSTYGKRIREIETDEAVLDRRQKQIDYGKNTVGYDYYMKQVPKEKRTTEHPWTPRKELKYSRRAFDGLVKIWRKELHCYDPANMKYCKSDDSEEQLGQGI